MKNRAIYLGMALMLAAAPAFAGEGPFFSMRNPIFVIIIAFVAFVAVLLYLKVPAMITKLLDDRAAGISAELDEARTLREEAQTLLASFERKQKEVAAHSASIVEHAKAEAAAAAEQAKEALKGSIARRLQAAEDQIASAEASAIKEVRDTAVNVAIAAAAEVITSSMGVKESGALIDASISEVGEKLH